MSLSAILVEIRGIPGRVSLASKNGPVLSSTEWRAFPLTEWIQRAAEHWGDIEIKASIEDVVEIATPPSKKSSPVETVVAEKPLASAEKS